MSNADQLIQSGHVVNVSNVPEVSYADTVLRDIRLRIHVYQDHLMLNRQPVFPATAPYTIAAVLATTPYITLIHFSALSNPCIFFRKCIPSSVKFHLYFPLFWKQCNGFMKVFTCSVEKHDVFQQSHNPHIRSFSHLLSFSFAVQDTQGFKSMTTRLNETFINSVKKLSQSIKI